MTQKFNSRVSAEGALLIADAVAKNTKMSFLKAYGSTTEFSDDQLAGLTDKDLTGASHNQTGHISNVAVDDATSTVHTEIVLDGNSVEADYGLNSILIVATVDGNEHLFAVLKANQVQYMNAYDGKSSTNLQINCSFKVSNTDVVDIIKVDTAGTLTRADYDKLHEFTVSQVAVTVTNVNKYTDTAMSKEAAARSAADSAENKARSDADTWETGQRKAADTTETNARIAADNAAASSVSKLTSTVAANYTSATVYADSAVAEEVTARSNAISSEAAARAAADVNLQKSVAANSSAIGVLRTSAAGYTDDKVASAATVASYSINYEARARSTADSSEAQARSDADVAINTKVTANSDADTWETGQRIAADTTETNARIAADNAETQARSAADTAEAKIRATADDALTASVGEAKKTVVIQDPDRWTNWTPAQCLANWPAQKVQHFKMTSSLGITMPSGYTSNYCVLTTKVPGVNEGYGGPIQIAEPTDANRPFTFKRVGVGIPATAWSAWELVTTW